MSDFKDKTREVLMLFQRDIERHYGGRTVGKTLNGDQALEALDTLFAEEVKRIIGEENEYSRDMPMPDPFVLPQDYANLMKRYQLKRAGLEEDTK